MAGTSNLNSTNDQPTLDHDGTSAIDNFVIGYGAWVAVSTPSRKSYHDFSEKSTTGSPPAVVGDNAIIAQVNSASITRSLQIPTQNSYYLPFDRQSAARAPAQSQIRLGYGIYSYNGEISFEFTKGMLRFLSNNVNNGGRSMLGESFDRNAIFDVQFFDGKRTCSIYNCVWNSISINAQPNSLVTGSISFQSNNGYHSNLFLYNDNVLPNYRFDDSDLNIPYWETGADEFETFSISFDRNVSPVYLNNDLKCPSYLRAGMITSSMNVTTIDHHSGWHSGHVGNGAPGDITVKLGDSKKFTLKAAAMTSQQIGLPSMSDVQSKQYSWSSMQVDPRDPPFIISS